MTVVSVTSQEQERHQTRRDGLKVKLVGLWIFSASIPRNRMRDGHRGPIVNFTAVWLTNVGELFFHAVRVGDKLVYYSNRGLQSNNRNGQNPPFADQGRQEGRSRCQRTDFAARQDDL
jgi:hypothetical protein